MPLSFKKIDVREFLVFYETFTKKPLFVSRYVEGLVTMETPKPLARAAAIESIRTTLLEKYGIEIRSTERGETLVLLSDDPRYPHRSDPEETEAERRAEAEKPSPPKRPRIRVIKPEPR